MLSINTFKEIVQNTPLVSIDFLIKNSENKYLLGKRTNKPAKDYWFTLGGRVLKDETIENAMKRLSKKEFGIEFTKETLGFHGVYEHMYGDSFVDDDISTHYIVLCYKIDLDLDLNQLPQDEHSEYSYFSKNEIMGNSYIHEYVKDYFK